jgi:hypothetical protein
MNSQELRALQEAYSQVYELDENRMASRMGKMPSAPAKVGKATHSIKDIAPSKEPSSKEKAKARKALGLDEASVTDDRVRRNQKAFGSNYTPPRDWDQSANRGKGAVVNAKQKEKQRRKGLAKSAMGEAVDLYDIILSHLLDEGYADTEQAAEAIMVNMSEDWRESIVEGAAGAFVPSKVDDSNNRRDMLKNRYGQDVSPRIPGPSGGGQFEKPSSNPAGALRLAKTSSKSDTKTA